MLFYSLLFLVMINPSLVIVDFNVESDLADWYIVDDGVMGGLSSGNMSIDKEGHARFYGEVSLDNNGGFTSVRYQFNTKKIEPYNNCRIRIKGDTKNYQFRVKSDASQRFSYIYEFETNGGWEEIVIPLSEMYPSFRGRKLDMPNFPNQQLEEIVFLIANKKEESFELMIDSITLE